MENFVVSARKYRPETFESVVGQGNITKTLKNAVGSNRLAHAYLFCGPRGVGKTTCARILAKTINCEHLNENFEPCGECDPCRSFNTNASFNIFELDAASNNSVHDIRALVDQVRIPPQVGRYKIYILDEVHMLSTEAFNAFLKTLEEPPAYAVFILATTEKHKVLPTILSRCQIFDFKRISNEDIVSHLKYVADKEDINYELEALHIIAQKADGGMRDSLSMFDQLASFTGRNLTYKRVIENLNVLDYDYYFKLADMILCGDYSSSFVLFDKILDAGFDGQFFLSGFSSHLRNVLVSVDMVTIPLIDGSEILKKRYADQAAKIGVVKLIKYIDICNSADLTYRTSNNKRLHVELTLLKMCGDNLNKQDVSSDQQTHNNIVTQKQTVIAVPSVQSKPVNSANTINPVANSGVKMESEQVKVLSNNIVEQGGQSVKSGMFGSFSIKAMEEELKKKRILVENENSCIVAKESITQEDLILKWSEFSKVCDAKYNAILNSHPPTLQNKSCIDFLIEGKLNENIFNDIKSDLMQFLRKNLGNNDLSLNVNVINPVTINSKPYTNPEKYEFLTKINPSLSKLKKEFMLDTDY